MKVPCPCCGYYTLTKSSHYEICPICCWEDVPAHDYLALITTNRVTLIEAQRNFLAYGACEEMFRGLARPPAGEERGAEWQPLDQRLREVQWRLLLHYREQQPPLLEILRPLITDDQLYIIANADRGNDVAAHFAALQAMRTGKILVPLRWEPHEVLALTRWHEPEQSSSHRGTEYAGHLRRAFACTCLVLAAGIPENRDRLWSENSTLIQLIASLLVLGESFQQAGLWLLSERILALDLEDSEFPFFAMGILLLAASLPITPPEQLGELAAWVMQSEARIRDKFRYFSFEPITDQWLLGLTTDNLRHSVWQRVTQQILTTAITSTPPAVTAQLQAILAHFPPAS